MKTLTNKSLSLINEFIEVILAIEGPNDGHDYFVDAYFSKVDFSH